MPVDTFISRKPLVFRTFFALENWAFLSYNQLKSKGFGPFEGRAGPDKTFDNSEKAYIFPRTPGG